MSDPREHTLSKEDDIAQNKRRHEARLLREEEIDPSILFSQGATFFFNPTVADYPRAIRLMRIASERGEAEASWILSVMAKKGLEMPSCHDDLLLLFDDESDGRSCCFRGWTIEDDDPETAFALYKRAIELDPLDKRAHARRGFCFDRGLGCAQSYELAAQCYKIAADLGHVSAAFNYAMCCEEGDGVEINWNEAERYYLQAASRSYGAAWYNVGLHYLDTDRTKAIKFFEQAALLGDTWAMVWVAEDYLRKCRDLDIPVFLLGLGARVGDSGALDMLKFFCMRRFHQVDCLEGRVLFELGRFFSKTDVTSWVGETMDDDESRAMFDYFVDSCRLEFETVVNCIRKRVLYGVWGLTQLGLYRELARLVGKMVFEDENPRHPPSLKRKTPEQVLRELEEHAREGSIDDFDTLYKQLGESTEGGTEEDI